LSSLFRYRSVFRTIRCSRNGFRQRPRQIAIPETDLLGA
jgi:hypothetical protein